jgi:hypothetical protein
VKQIKTPSRDINYVVRSGDNLGGVFALATRVSRNQDESHRNEIGGSSRAGDHGLVRDKE